MPLHILEISHKQCSFRSNIFSRFLSQLCIFQLTLYDPAIYKIILWTLHSFSNAMKSKMLFFYRLLIVTDFQPTNARRAFPCFDEPALKAIFNVSIVTPDASWMALSNADEIVSVFEMKDSRRPLISFRNTVNNYI